MINNVLRDYNNFVQLAFKNKGKDYDFGNIKHLAKRFGIVINQKLIQEEVGQFWVNFYRTGSKRKQSELQSKKNC